MNSVKRHLYLHCLDYIDNRIAAAQQVIASAQSAANEETKSSAGDKYETGKAMAQLEIEKSAVQLTEALHLKNTLELLSKKKSLDTVQAGNLVITDQGNFYLSIPAGECVVENQKYFTLSVNSPIGKCLLGLRAGSIFSFRERIYTVLSVA